MRISKNTSRFIGAAALVMAVAKRHFKDAELDQKAKLAECILAAHTNGETIKTALTTSDIPLPEEFATEISALADIHGAARRHATLYPMATGTAKIPKLKTDVEFELMAMSAQVPEKSPQMEWVEMEAKKRGGLVNAPSEIVADGGAAFGNFLVNWGARAMAKAEDALYFIGDGTAPYDNLEGLAFSVITNSKAHQLTSGKTAYSQITISNCRSVRDVVDAAVRQDGGAYYCHPSFEQLFNSYNTDGDRPFNPNTPNGPTLDGYPVRWVPVMPVYSASANAGKVAVLFGDTRYQFLGYRPGINLQVAAQVPGYFESDLILFRFTERFTIGLMANGAFAGIQTAAS